MKERIEAEQYILIYSFLHEIIFILTFIQNLGIGLYTLTGAP